MQTQAEAGDLAFLYQTASQVKHWGKRAEAGETCRFVSVHLSHHYETDGPTIFLSIAAPQSHN